jgi:hypothetical protein
MHAIVRRKYGTPDVLAYEVIARPVPGEEDVLVRVHAAGASIGIVTGKPYLIRLTPFGGMPRPRNPVGAHRGCLHLGARGSRGTRRDHPSRPR